MSATGTVDIAALQSDLVALSSWIDGSYPAALDPEAALWRRVHKASREASEALEELSLLVGENPRKPRTESTDALVYELLDTATAALGAVEHVHGNRGVAVAMLAAHVARVCDRGEAHGLIRALADLAGSPDPASLMPADVRSPGEQA